MISRNSKIQRYGMKGLATDRRRRFEWRRMRRESVTQFHENIASAEVFIGDGKSEMLERGSLSVKEFVRKANDALDHIGGDLSDFINGLNEYISERIEINEDSWRDEDGFADGERYLSPSGEKMIKNLIGDAFDDGAFTANVIFYDASGDMLLLFTSESYAVSSADIDEYIGKTTTISGDVSVTFKGMFLCDYEPSFLSSEEDLGEEFDILRKSIHTNKFTVGEDFNTDYDDDYPPMYFY